VKQFPNLVLGILVVLALALGSVQGRRVERLQESDRLYRWVQSASTQMRVFGNPGQPPPGEDPTNYVDDELFAKLVEISDRVLPDVDVGENDYDNTGKPYPRIVRYTAAPITDADESALALDEDGEEVDEEGLGSGQQEIYTEEQRQRDGALWAFAQSEDTIDLRKELVIAHRAGRVAGFGTQMGIAGLYQVRGTNISLANMFFGFRKMAANMLWLEVDRFWHKGEMQRMLPLMKSCVTLDPTFIDAFLLGSWHMAYNATAPLEDTPWELREYDPVHEYWVGERENYYFFGVDFLKDGIRKNPRNYRLYFDLGYSIYEEKLIDHVNAIKYLEQATRLDHDRWVRRQLYRIQGLNEQYEESKAGWEDYLKWQPENAVAPRFIELMKGEILDRDTMLAGLSAEKAEEMAEQLQQRGEDPAPWQAKAAEARARETELSTQAKAHWKTLVVPGATGSDEDTYVTSRLLRIEAAELRTQDRYDEAVVALEQGRWMSNEFWNFATATMIEYKQEAGLPLAVTELRYIERDEAQLEYTRHMPQPIAGHLYRFFEGTWIRDDYRKESLTPIQQDSDEAIILQYEHPELARVFSRLDGNLIVKAGDTWYDFRATEPSKPSKLNPYDPA